MSPAKHTASLSGRSDLPKGAELAHTPEEQAFIAEARRHCQQSGSRLTPLRIEVLLHLRQHPGGIKAYDLLSNLQSIKPGIAPMSIYRTLDFLVASGLVHKVDATSSFIVCEHGHHDHHEHGAPVMLICEQCGRAMEISDPEVHESLRTSLAHIHALHGFQAHGLEIKGNCRQCLASPH